MRYVGEELLARLEETVLGLELDNRALPMDRAHDEEDLARLLIAASWCQVNYRTPIGFSCTPLSLTAHEDPGAFTLDRLLQLPDRDMVADVVAQLYRAADGPLDALRARTRPKDCMPGPTFPTSRIGADADLAVDGLLLDFKSTRHPRTLRQAEAWQLTGYLLLDTADQYRIDSLGLYLTRSCTLAAWPVEEYLELLGACRRDLAAFRAAFTGLLEGCTADTVPYKQETGSGRCCGAWPPSPPGPLHGVHAALPRPRPPPREFCSTWCRSRAQTLRTKGLLPGGPALLLPRPRKQRLDLPNDATIVDLTVRSPG
jgi:hypothetical protein